MGMAQPCHTAFMYTCGCGGQTRQPGDRPGSSPSPPGRPATGSARDASPRKLPWGCFWAQGAHGPVPGCTQQHLASPDDPTELPGTAGWVPWETLGQGACPPTPRGGQLPYPRGAHPPPHGAHTPYSKGSTPHPSESTHPTLWGAQSPPIREHTPSTPWETEPPPLGEHTPHSKGSIPHPEGSTAPIHQGAHPQPLREHTPALHREHSPHPTGST